MKRRLIRLFAGVACGLALLGAAMWILIQTLGDSETLYRGKTLYYWSEQAKGPNAASSNQAFLILSQEIIPKLTNTMFWDTNDSTLRLRLIENLNSLPGVNIYFRTADSRRQNAAAGLGEFGPAAESVFPSLLRAFQGSDIAVKGAAAVSLGKIRAKPDTTIPLLIRALYDEYLREDAAEALGEFGPASAPAIPRLTELLEVREKELHHAVIEALKKIVPPSNPQSAAP
jgi:hypothetical protein